MLEQDYPSPHLNVELITAIEGMWDFDTIKILVKSGHDIDSRNARGVTCLEAAIRRGCPQIVELLLNNGADITARTSSTTHSIIEVFFRMLHQPEVDNTKKLAILQILLAHGVQLEFLRDYPCIPLTVLQEISLDVLKVLLASGMQVPSYYEEDGMLATFSVMRNSDHAVLHYLVLNNYIDLETRDAQGRTSLMFEANWGNTDHVVRLLSLGANPDTFNGLESALFLSMSEGEVSETFQVLFFKCNGRTICTVFALAMMNHKNNYVEFITKETALRSTNTPHPLSIALSTYYGEIFTTLFNDYVSDLRNNFTQEFCGGLSWVDVLLTKNTELLLKNHVLCDYVSGIMRPIPPSCHFWADMYKKICSIRIMCLKKHKAQQILCKLLNIDVRSYPHIIHQIMDYLCYDDILNLQDVLHFG
ncbi:hypothetical protein QAD02_017720 [Eretmocerus hayati]|uniref:Uncharacterized protein n=1 Tax=Eretmocerus hayati TaxID=131215 RepID=A0ACC2PFV3_9HYME|nr:hypothetical protein QAD02_017720 [Eretmocerus hayati]